MQFAALRKLRFARVEDGASFGSVHVCPRIGSFPLKDVFDYQPGTMEFRISKESEGTVQCALS